MIGMTWSRKIYKGIKGLGNSPLISPLQVSEEERTQVSLRKAASLIRYPIPQLSPPLMPSTISPISPPYSPTPPPPTPQFNMASAIKLPVFRGVGNEDRDQFWFVVKVVWEEQGVMDDNIKKVTLVSTLQDHALTWYIMHSNDHPNAGITEIQNALNREFSQLKSETQSITKFKQITTLLGKTPQDLDQRLKSAICEASMMLTDVQHRAWFVASLTPHLRMALSQQKLSSQAEALEIAMRLHETLIQDLGLGVQQIHVQLQKLCLEMKILNHDRAPQLEAREEVWCIKCKGQSHDKDHYLVFTNYLAGGGPMPLRPEAQVGPSVAPTLWCAICQDGGKHMMNNCHLLQKYTQTSQQLF